MTSRKEACICRAFLDGLAVESWPRGREALLEMHIAFLRTGGFAGMRVACEIDTEKLSAEEARQLSEYVDAANFFELPEVSRSGGADQLQYKISVEKEGKMRAVETDERAMPPSLSPLVKWLTAAARRGAAHGSA